MTAATPTFSIWRRLCHTRLRDVLRGRLDSSLDWRQTVALAELPEELAEAVRQVVGRTRLWRSEKVDVAAELVAHFQDGLAATRSSADLLQSFGELRAAAQLIRRAKRRGRPMLWHAWHYGWMSVVALLIVYVATGLWMATGRPSVKTDYIAVFNKPVLAVPEDQRAWPLYRDALLAMGADKKQGSSVFAELAENDAKPGDESWKESEKFLHDHADSIAKLREAAKRPNLGFVTSTSHADFSEQDRRLFGVTLTPEQIDAAKKQTLQDRWLISALLPEMQYLRDSASLLASDARRAALAGDGNTAWGDMNAIFGISRHCEEMPFLICVVMSELVQQKARAAIQDILTDHPKLWSDEQLRDLAHQLAASRIDWRRGFEGERACFYDSMQRVYTDNGRGDGRLALNVSNDQNLFQLLDSITSEGSSSASMVSNKGIAMFTLPAANMVVASRKETTDLYDKVTNQALARLGTPYWERSTEPSLDDEVKSLKSGPLGKYRYLFVLLLTPAYDTVLNKVVVSDGECDGVFLGLALELYHREHGKWPESLGELSPRWLPTLPVDPITGKPLHYKVVKDRPVVYSVGADGDDDGGRRISSNTGETTAESSSGLAVSPTTAQRAAPPDGDWVIWTTAKSD